ncbi:MAG: hypothetical protein U1E76_17870 [Planctomycetota bacterium]
MASQAALATRPERGYLVAMILDRSHFRITLNDGQQLTLSPKTFVALAYLAEHAGQPITRAALDQQLKTRGRVEQVIHSLEQTFPGRVVADAVGVRLLLDPAQIRSVGAYADADDED